MVLKEMCTTQCFACERLLMQITFGRVCCVYKLYPSASGGKKNKKTLSNVHNSANLFYLIILSSACQQTPQKIEKPSSFFTSWDVNRGLNVPLTGGYRAGVHTLFQNASYL